MVGARFRSGDPPPSVIVLQNYNCSISNCLKTPLEASEAAKHEADHRDRDERLAGGAEALVLLAEPTVLALPSERSFDHPPPRQHPESWRRQLLGPVDLVGWEVVGDPDFLVPRRMGDDLRAPAACLLDPVLALPLAVGGGIQPDLPPARKRGTHARAQHELHAVAIPDVRWRHDGAQDHSFRVDQHGALAPRHRLAPLVATPSPHAGGLHRLTVAAAGAGRGIPPQAPAQPLTQRRVEALPRRLPPPLSPGVLHRLPRRPFLRQQPPGPARAQRREDGSADDAQRVETGTADRRLGRQERLEQGPLTIREVAG